MRSGVSRRRLSCCAAIVLLAVAWSGCSSKSGAPIVEEGPPEKLSAYGLFVGNGATQEPAAGVIPYALNTPLFSDYTSKYRFVKLPAGTSATYHAEKPFDFPVGTVIAKTFAYPHDMRDPSQGERLLETRILVHEESGWVGLPYLWNEEQTEATLQLGGRIMPVSWTHTDGAERKIDYLVPNANQCKGCHKVEDNIMRPIGPKGSQLNGDFVYAGGSENQLTHWTKAGALSGAPAPADAPRMAVWDDPHSGTLDERARAWLDVNCAHCHNGRGPARNSGLDLSVAQAEPFKFGIFKPPVAAGRGSGGLKYDIVPGEPDQSILAFRIASSEADVMMPELGKRLVHEEGVELIREWIAAMPAETSAKSPQAGQ
ncbi:MAG: hypothetical protein KF708_05930 [Pirellulales bacterium]|nr:hypothetical protein [Pirellulales bacterium]